MIDSFSMEMEDKRVDKILVKEGVIVTNEKMIYAPISVAFTTYLLFYCTTLGSFILLPTVLDMG